MPPRHAGANVPRTGAGSYRPRLPWSPHPPQPPTASPHTLQTTTTAGAPQGSGGEGGGGEWNSAPAPPGRAQDASRSSALHHSRAEQSHSFSRRRGEATPNRAPGPWAAPWLMGQWEAQRARVAPGPTTQAWHEHSPPPQPRHLGDLLIFHGVAHFLARTLESFFNLVPPKD